MSCHRCGKHKFDIAGAVEALRRVVGRISNNPNSPRLRAQAVELKEKLTAQRTMFADHQATHDGAP